VFAARTRIANVVIWTAQYMNAPGDPAGKAARAISETSETLLLGRACMCTASHETPMKSVIAIVPMTRSVFAAFTP